MSDRKAYGQFCGLARSLDRIGDRWTLLVVRELLLGPKTYRDLLTALDPITPTLLAGRTSALIEDGLVERNDAPQRSKSVRYALTDAGRDLEPVVLELIRWGTRWMMNGPGPDRSDPAWAPLALRALLDGHKVKAAGSINVDVAGTWVTIRSLRGRRVVSAGRARSADAIVSAELPALLAVAAGAMNLSETSISVSGDAEAAARMLAPA